ncbi:MAG: hypothetical protein ABFC89_12440 [Methanospirillum sp.]
MVLREFERRGDALLPVRTFYLRLAKFALFSLILILISLGIGIGGYMALEGMEPVDAFLNAAMLMGGMGPVTTLSTQGGKIFAGLYAMYCGFVLLISVALFVTPIFHRLLHHFHLEGKER